MTCLRCQHGTAVKAGTTNAHAIFMTWYNFVRVHQTLRVTPAMEAGLTDHVWSIRELLTTDTLREQVAA